MGIDAKPDAPRDCCGDAPQDVGMFLADQDEDRQFRNPGGPQVCGLHADTPLFQQHGVQPRGDEVPKLQSSGNIVKSAHICQFESNLGSEVVRVIDEWSIEFGHHGIDGADVHDHPSLPVPFRRH